MTIETVFCLIVADMKLIDLDSKMRSQTLNLMLLVAILANTK